MVICSLDALKKSSKKKETRIETETVQVFQQPSYRRKKPERWNSWLWPYICWLHCISCSAITGYFQKFSFQVFNLLIWIFELPSAFLYASCVMCVKNYTVLCENMEIGDSLLCVANRCINVTRKLILPSVPRFG